jgi:hypothetical protein
VKLPQRRVLDWLVSEEPCLGAAFCTYNFDPAFFEEQVLRAVLKLRTDPEEQALAFHDEARAGLQATPVAVIGDASMARPGRRLPYDLLLIRSHTFHPKLALAVYETHARVTIGSCNLTRGGYDQNVELVFARELRYDDAADVAALRALDQFIERSAELRPRRGTQLGLVQDALRARLPAKASNDTTRDYQILHSFDGPILEQLFALVPANAVITRVGVLAPFFERDDEDISETDAMGSMLASVMQHRRADGAVLDLAASWVDAVLAPEPGAVPPLESALGALWAWRYSVEIDGAEREVIEYLVPVSLGPSALTFRNARGETKRWPREGAETDIEKRRLWPVRQPTLSLPRAIVTYLAEKFDLRLWLHPNAALDERGKVARRGLHAKLFVIATKLAGKENTYVLMGSPNASRAAMLRSVAEGGNVELAVVAVVEGTHALIDFVPNLILSSPDRVDLVEREYAELQPDPSAWILDVVHDAAVKDLTVEWATEASAPLGPWTLSYEGKQLATGGDVPTVATVVRPFELSATSAELVLAAGGREVSVPIRVADLAQLPTTVGLGALGLRELLALLGRRLGTERLSVVRAQRGQEGADAMLEAIFGAGFGPVDVFKAWWGLTWELEQPLSVPAFRHRLTGPLGARVVWQRLREEAGKSLGADEAWVYGCELLRALRSARVSEGADRESKRALLIETCVAIQADLTSMRPVADGRAWVDAVTTFYEREVANV